MTTVANGAVRLSIGIRLICLIRYMHFQKGAAKDTLK